MVSNGGGRVAGVGMSLVLASASLGQTTINSNWDGATANWSQTVHWSPLGGADPYPDNGVSFVYNVVMPAGGGPYTVSANVAGIVLLSLDTDANTTLVLTSTDFDPGLIVNDGRLELQNDDLMFRANVTNAGTITWDLDTSGESMQINADLTLGGTGTLTFPNIGTTSTGTHVLFINNNQTLTHGVGHTIQGGPGSIQFTGGVTTDDFINNGSVLANVSGKTLLIYGFLDRLEVINNNILRAESGGTLLLQDLQEVTNSGTISCASGSEITIDSTGTNLAGTFNVDGLMRVTNNSSITFAAAMGSGSGEYRQSSGSTTFGLGTTVEFGTVNLETGTLAVNAGALLTARDLFTHGLTTEANHTFNATAAVRITGGTSAGVMDYDDFAALEIAGLDMGHIPAGFTGNFELPRLRIGPGAKVNLFDVLNNGNRDGSVGVAEALYVNTLEFEDAAGLLNLNGHNLYYNTLVGNPAQIVDSGGDSGKGVATTWTCTNDTWSDTGCWDTLAPGDAFPDNDVSTAYEVILPANGGSAYAVTVEVTAVAVRSLSVHADASVILTSTDFDPGLLLNNGRVELQTDDLFLGQTLTNNGIITWDSDTSGETIQLSPNADVALNGIGTLTFPNIGTTSTGTHVIFTNNNQTLTNGVGHTLQGGPGSIQYSGGLTTDDFINNGTVLANVNGKTLLVYGFLDRLEVINNNLMRAENGGTLLFQDLQEITNNGTISCAAGSEITIDSTGTNLAGTISVNGLIRLVTNSSVTFTGAVGSGIGEYRQSLTGGATTYAGGTTVSFGTINLEAGTFTVNAGALVTVRDLFTHRLTNEASHSYHASTSLRITGGTTAGPMDFDDFSGVEIAGVDIGHIPAGFTNNFQLPRLRIGPAAKVNLFDVVNNGNRDGSAGVAEALYVDTLEFEDAAGVLNLNGHHLYYNTLIGNVSQIADSGGGSGKGEVATWTCASGNWSNTACWSGLGPGHTYPLNDPDTAYDVILPDNGPTYTVIVDVPTVTVRSLNLNIDATVVPNATDFDPGRLTNGGRLEMQADDLFLGQNVTNNGILTWDLDTSAETIQLSTNADVALNGSGTLTFPNIGTTSTSTHVVFTNNNQTLTNGAGHTIQGGPGSIQYSGGLTTDDFINHGTVRANVNTKTLLIYGFLDRLEVINNNLMRAECGGTLLFQDLQEITNSGIVSCAAGSEVTLDSTGTNLAGTLNIDGLMRLVTNASVTFTGAGGSGAGEYRQVSGSTTYGTGTTVQFGTLNIQAGTLTANSGSLVTVSRLYTHALTTESSHSYQTTSAVRAVGGVGQSLCDLPNLNQIEAAGTDLGTDPVNHVGAPAGFVSNFQLPRLKIGPAARVALVDLVNNGNRGGVGGMPEALYVDTLEFEDANGRLLLNGIHLYYNSLIGNFNQIVASLATDCNMNTVSDVCDILGGTSDDCNGNEIPDECDIPQGSPAPGGPFYCMSGCDPDCNVNGVPDVCDITGPTSDDLNANNVPDECEDCNNNMVPDPLDILNQTSEDCDGDGIPDECEGGFTLYTWIGPDGGSFAVGTNWMPNGVPGGDALLSNSGLTDNRAVLSAAGVTTVCALTVEASGAGRQRLRINAGSALEPVTGSNVNVGGEIELNGGTLGGGTVNNAGTSITGFGTVAADLINTGLVQGAASATLTLNGMTLDNEPTGELLAPAGATVLVQSLAVTQEGSIEVRTLAGMIFTADINNSAGAEITLLGGSLSTPQLVNAVGGLVSGFGIVDAEVTNDGDINITADSQIVGDVENDGTVTVQSGLLTITGSLTGSGTILGDFSSPLPASAIGETERDRGLRPLAKRPVADEGDSSVAALPTGAGVTVVGDLVLGATATLSLVDAALKIGGDFDIAVNDALRFNLTQGTLQFVGVGIALQTLEMTAPNVGSDVVLPDANLFSIDRLRIGPAHASVGLIDAHDNAPGVGPEVLYVDELVFDPGITLDLAGRIIYYGTVVPADPLAPGSGVTILDSVGGGRLIPIGPLVPTLGQWGVLVLSLLLGSAGTIVFHRRLRRRYAGGFSPHGDVSLGRGLPGGGYDGR